MYNIIQRRRYTYKKKGVLLATFAGLNIAPGPLTYKSGVLTISDSWIISGQGSIKGTQEGSYYFTNPRNITTSGIVYNNMSGWRLPTQSELSAIVGTGRAGSVVNGSSGKHYALIQLASGALPNIADEWGGGVTISR